MCYAFDQIANAEEQTEKELRIALEDYLNLVFTAGDNRKGNDGYNTVRLSETAKIAESERVAGLERMEQRMECIFDRVDISVADIVLEHGEEDLYYAQVYEVTGILYHYEGSEELPDYAAFGVWHDLTLQKENEKWKVIYDAFDESTVTGVVSTEGAFSINGVQEKSQEGALEGNSFIQDVSEPERSSTFSYDYWIVNFLLEYAVQYCGIPANTRRSGYSEWVYGSNDGNVYSYNPIYGIVYNGSDCANFVSQCLHEGAGMPTNSVWYPDEYNGEWSGVCELTQYLEDTYDVDLVSVSTYYTNIFTGNPVYWTVMDGNSTNHIMICVGRNSQGIPVLCAHTQDIFRVPITNYSDKYLKTALITTTEYHTSHSNFTGYYYNSGYHYHVCRYCEYRSDMYLHVPDAQGNCIVCGAIGPFETTY